MHTVLKKCFAISTLVFLLAGCKPGVYYPLGGNPNAPHTESQPAKPLGTLETKSYIIPS